MAFLLRALGFALLLVISISCSSRSPGSAASRVEFYRARTAGPGTYPAYTRLGSALLDQYRETGDEHSYAEAIQSFEKSLAFQRNADALLGLGMALAEKHQFKRALPYLREAADSMPENAGARAALFDAHLALGDEQSASAVLESLRRSGCPAFICGTRGAALAEYHGDYNTAIVEMQRATSAAAESSMPAMTRAWSEVRLGSLHMMAGEAAPARDCYERALKLVPRYFFAREHLAEWQAARGDWAGAEKLYRQLLKDHPESGYRVALAEAVERQNRAPEGRRHVQRALQELRDGVARGAVDHYRELAVLLLCEGEAPAEALDLARRDWTLREDIFAADTLAWALSANGRHEEALRLSGGALALNPSHPALLLHGAIIRFHAGRRAEAGPLLARAKSNPYAFTTGERKALAQAEALQ